MNKIKTIVFTGGHHNCALLVANKLKKDGYRVLWLGHRHTSNSDKNISQEYKDVMAADITFIDLKSGKVYRGNVWQLLKTLSSFFFCLSLFLKERPSLIVSFGGYLAVPPVIAAWLLRIPSIAHEQTTVLGLANKTILPFVNYLYLSWPITRYKDNKKTKVIGLPLEIKKYDNVAKIDLKFANPEKPLLVISGGKQGSHAINELIERCLKDLLPHWNILHQCGSNLSTRDYQRLNRKKLQLPYEMQKSYIIAEYISNFHDVIMISDLIIGRSGAHTTMEILQMGKKMIAIPLPNSYGDEQIQNAQKLVEASLAIILPQTQANVPKLLELVNQMENKTVDRDILIKAQNKLPINALETMTSEIKSIVSKL